jgi:hypothetical protein
MEIITTNNLEKKNLRPHVLLREYSVRDIPDSFALSRGELVAHDSVSRGDIISHGNGMPGRPHTSVWQTRLGYSTKALA